MKKMIAGLIVCLVVFSCSVEREGEEEGTSSLHFKEFTRKIEESLETGASCDLIVSVDDCEMEITGWDEPGVSITGELVISAPNREKADDVYESFSITGDNGEVSIRHEGDSVKVVSGGCGCNVIRTCTASFNCELRVPYETVLQLDVDDGFANIREIAGNIEIDGDDLDVDIQNIKAGSLDINLDDGEINGSAIEGHIKINVDDGNVDLNAVVSDKISVAADDGDLAVETTVDANGSYEFNTDDGDITFAIPEDAGLEIDITKDDGKFECEFPLEGSMDHNKIKGKIGGAAARLKINTDDGDIHIKKAAAKRELIRL